MAIAQKVEARALNADERVLVEKSHHPALQDLPDNQACGSSEIDARAAYEGKDSSQPTPARNAREVSSQRSLSVPCGRGLKT